MRPTFIVAAAGFAALTILSSPAWAQANRTFVSGHGSDANPCSLSAPCRSFAQALNQTNAGGEITVLDPAGYGAVNITQSVSIVNDGVGEAGVTVTSSTDAITVNTGASDVVNLRGLTLVGGGVGNAGIFFANLGTLNVQNCVIRGFTNSGISVQPLGSAAVNVSDTIISSNNDGGATITAPNSGTLTAVFDRVQAISNGSGSGFLVNGSSATGVVNVTIANSTASNQNAGIFSQSSSGPAVVMVVNSVIANNSFAGISVANANSTTYLSKNAVTGNGQAFFVALSGALFSFGDNDIKGNGNDGGAIPLVSAK